MAIKAAQKGYYSSTSRECLIRAYHCSAFGKNTDCVNLKTVSELYFRLLESMLIGLYVV